VRPDKTTLEMGRILFSGIFSSGSIEAAFRRRYLRQDLLLSTGCVLTATVGAVFFLLHDYALFGTSAQFYGLLALRGSLILVSLAAMFMLYRCTSPRKADHILFLWCLLIAAGHAYALTTRPTAFVWHPLMCVAIVYCVFPLPLTMQICLAASFSAAIFALEVCLGLGVLSLLPIAGAFLLINGIGALASWQRNHRRRQVYLAWMQETQLRQQLEQALAEVKTLQGMLSICAWCKRIRNEDEWLPVEEYVKERSQADFTHGICPHCLGQQLKKQGYPSPASDRSWLSGKPETPVAKSSSFKPPPNAL
jgi:hypothetical protein